MPKKHFIPNPTKGKGFSPVKINFHDTPIITIEKDKNIYVALKPICEGMGIGWESQLKRIKRDPVLNSVMVSMTTTGKDDKLYQMLTMPLQYLNGWLFKINANQYKNETRRETIIRYQKECYSALHDYFNHGAAINPRIPESPAKKQLSDQTGPLKRAENKIKKLKSDKQWMEGRIRGLEAENIILKDSLAIAERFAEEFKELAKSAHQLCRGAQRLCSDAFGDLDKKRMNESRAWEEDETADSHERREQLGNYMIQ